MLLLLAALAGAATVGAIRRWAREIDRSVWSTVAVAAAAAALGAAAFDAAPTGEPAIDAVMRAALFAITAVAGGTAHRVAMLLSGALAMAVLLQGSAALDWSGSAALGGAAVLAATLAKPHGARLTGALIATALTAMALTITWTPTGMPSLAAAAILAPVLITGSWFARSRTRRIVSVALVSVVVAAGLASVGTVVAGLQARSSLLAAVDEARSGLDVLSADADRDQATEQISSARDSFVTGRRALHAWYAKPGLAVPIVAQHLRAAGELAESGEELTAAASDVLAALDPARLKPDAGKVDLGALAALDDSLTQADEAMGTGRQRLDALDNPWLLPLLTERRDGLTDDLAAAQERTVGVQQALSLVRSMLGEGERRRYLLAVQTLSEARATGGWWGNWGFLEADDGQLELTALGRMLELSPPQPFDLTGLPAEYLDRYGFIGLTEGIGRMNVTPDLPTVGEVVTSVFPQIGRGPIDGLIVLDPYGLAAVLRITGPISVSGWPEPITSENAPRILLFDTYNALEGDDRVDVIGNVAGRAWQALLAADTNDLRALVDALRPAVQAKHIQLYSVRPDEQAELERLELAGSVPVLTCDGLQVVTQNLSASKVDWFLTRSTSYDVTVDPATGAVEATLTVELRNGAPSTGLADDVIGYLDRTDPSLTGTNRSWITVYTPLATEEATLDGRTFPVSAQPELGRNAYQVTAVVPPNEGTAVLRLTLRGTLPPAAGYRLDIGRQPLAQPERIAVTVRATQGWTVATSNLAVVDGVATGAVEAAGDAAVTATFAPAE